MAYSGSSDSDISLPAAADLSAYQYHFMMVDASGYGTVALAATSRIVGVLQNKPEAVGDPCQIRIAGISKIVGGAALAEGECLTSTPIDATTGSACGFGTAAAATSIGCFIGGIVLTATGASADIGEILVTRYQI